MLLPAELALLLGRERGVLQLARGRVADLGAAAWPSASAATTSRQRRPPHSSTSICRGCTSSTIGPAFSNSQPRTRIRLPCRRRDVKPVPGEAGEAPRLGPDREVAPPVRAEVEIGEILAPGHRAHRAAHQDEAARRPPRPARPDAGRARRRPSAPRPAARARAPARRGRSRTSGAHRPPAPRPPAPARPAPPAAKPRPGRAAGRAAGRAGRARRRSDRPGPRRSRAGGGSRATMPASTATRPSASRSSWAAAAPPTVSASRRRQAPPAQPPPTLPRLPHAHGRCYSTGRVPVAQQDRAQDS